ncbi:PREDICTED: 14.7 kDa heat shock protein [Ipomoea nil]|uniref:14.7 kDa heat shock protein n=1 Tax=Ipomoea nil TaxID=35883 RepID=UPI000901B145|nr:PREDICTED: 14.7 kDa heat shock protein [Ipomoea nil]
MASSMTLRNAIAASSIFTKFLSEKFPSTAATPIISRLFSSSTTGSGSSTVDPDDPPFVLQGAPQKFKMENPFQTDGPGNVILADTVKEGTLVRVTMPGVGPDGFKVWTEKNSVYFAGKGEIEMEGEESGRNYGGSLKFKPEINRVHAVKAEMKNGVLKLFVPRVGSAQDEER